MSWMMVRTWGPPVHARHDAPGQVPLALWRVHISSRIWHLRLRSLEGYQQACSLDARDWVRGQTWLRIAFRMDCPSWACIPFSSGPELYLICVAMHLMHPSRTHNCI